MKRAIVVDASVAWKWFNNAESNADVARALFEEPNAIYAPDLIGPELFNILWKRARRGEVSPDLATRIFAEIAGLQIRPSMPLMPSAWSIATSLDHSVYDCVYLALAKLIGCKLVTADRKLYDKVIASPMAPAIHWLEDPL